MQQRLRIQQCFTTDGGYRCQAPSAAGRRIEHPLRNFQESSFEVLFDAAVEQCAPISGEGLVDRHNPVVPRMPRVMDFSRFSTMGVALSTCITRAGLISASGRTPPAGPRRTEKPLQVIIAIALGRGFRLRSTPVELNCVVGPRSEKCLSCSAT